MKKNRRFRSLRLEPTLVAAITQPLPLDTTRLGLAHQLDCLAPVKFALTPQGDGCAIAEIPRTANLHDCEKLASQALDGVESWIDRGFPASGETQAERESQGVALGAAGSVDSEIATSLDKIGWSWEEGEGATYRVFVTTASGSIGRVKIQRMGSNALHVSSESTVQVSDVVAMEALAHFALDTNRRLRIARLTVSDADGEAIRLVWDAIAPAELGVSVALPRLIEAVAFARADTSLALVALADECIAALYLDHRFPVQRKPGRQSGVDWAHAGAVPAEAESMIQCDNQKKEL